MIHPPGAERASCIFVIQPNRSMSWRELLTVWAVISATVLAIGVYWFFAGLPLVLPFSGLEVILLGAAFYLTARRSSLREVVTIGPESVIVESGRATPEKQDVFPRQWARLVLQRRQNSWYPSRLLVRSHGRQVEIGRFLNEQERQGLAARLGQVLRPGSVNDSISETREPKNRGIKHVS